MTRALVGFDTATPSTAVAVLTPGGRGAEARDDPPPGERPAHTSGLLGLLDAAMAASRVTWADVDRIAVGVGPGGFTGLRIGVATARALAQANDVPVVPVGTLHALALGAMFDGPGGTWSLACIASERSVRGGNVPSDEMLGASRPPERSVPDGDAPMEDLLGAAPDQPVAAVLDARRGEAFVAVFASAPPAPPVFGPAELKPDALAAHVPSGALAVGDGAVRFRDELERAGAVVPADGSPLHRVSAVQVCRLGMVGEPVDRDALVPDYVREPDARPPS